MSGKFSLDLHMAVSIYRYGMPFSLSRPRHSLMTLSCQATDLFLELDQWNVWSQAWLDMFHSDRG